MNAIEGSDVFSSSVLKKLMFDNELTETALSQFTSIPQPTIHRLVSEKTPNPRILTLTKISNYFGITVDQLIGHEPLPTGPDGLSELRCIPILQWADLAGDITLLSTSSRSRWSHWTHVDVPCSAQTFALPSKAALTPMVPAGALLSIDCKREPQDGDIILVLFEETRSAGLRRLCWDGDIRELHFLDTSRDPRPQTDQTKVLGTLIQTKFSYAPV